MGCGATDHATVLVVDDEDRLGDLFESALAADHEVLRAENGGVALSKPDVGIDVVLLDRRMPDVSGDQVLDEIEARGLDCRVAIVTAVDPDFDVIDVGFDDYLTKPVRPVELRETVRRLLALAEYERKYQDLSSKLVKRSVLAAEKTPAELDDSERFAELEAPIADLEAELEEMEAEAGFDDRFLPD